MKRISAIVLCALLLLCGCAREEEQPPVGIGPYALSQEQEKIITAFGMGDDVLLLKFNAPAEAISMTVDVQRLTDGRWETYGGGSISIGQEREPVELLSGTIAVTPEAERALDFTVRCAGQVRFSTDPVALEEAPMVSTWAHLEQRQDIALDQPIPVALYVFDSGTSMRGYTTADYHDPSAFDGMDLVQAVTVTFTAQ